LKNHPEVIALGILILLLAFSPLAGGPRPASRDLHIQNLILGDDAGPRIELPFAPGDVGEALRNLFCPRFR
jgi:hypothetical protein